jgi:hypothetical protein
MPIVLMFKMIKITANLSILKQINTEFKELNYFKKVLSHNFYFYLDLYLL